ncbi:MAG: hypothetical protein Q4C49_01115 [Bacillota bacterium]|nr:hypothetical protein [Bacillota bacterium]
MATNNKKKELSREELEIFRKKQSMQAMYFNRFLMIRYFTAVLFFMAIYWTYLNFVSSHWMIVFSVAAVVLSVMATLQLFTAYSTREPNIKWVKLFYNITPIAIPVLMILICIFNPSVIMPFLTGNMTSRIVMLCFLAIFELMAIACRIRIIQIESKTDKQYQRILQLSKYNKL